MEMCTNNEITSLLHNSSYSIKSPTLINIEGKDNMSGSPNELLEIAANITIEFNIDHLHLLLMLLFDSGIENDLQRIIFYVNIVFLTNHVFRSVTKYEIE